MRLNRYSSYAIGRDHCFRKLFPLRCMDKAEFEFMATSMCWASGLPVPRPRSFGTVVKLNFAYVDFDFIRFHCLKPCAPSFIADSVLGLATRISTLPVSSRVLTRTREYRRDLLYHVNLCLENPPHQLRRHQNILDELPKRIPSRSDNFIHGDFGPHNVGLRDNGMIFFDLEWACAGPEHWDRSYFLACLDPGSPMFERIFSRSSQTCVWQTAIVAAVRVGRQIARGQQPDNKVSILQWWLQQASK